MKAGARTPGRGYSLHAKLTAIILAALAVLTVAVSWFSLTREERLLRDSLNDKATTFGRMLMLGAAPAIAFHDRQTARELIESVALDQDFAAASLFEADGTVLERRGDLVAGGKMTTGDFELISLPTRLRVVSPVAPAEGPTGVLVLELSYDRLREARELLLRQIVLRAFMAMAVGGLLAYRIGRGLGIRIRMIEQTATAVAAGDLGQGDIPIGSNDEIGRTAAAFNEMMATIREQVATSEEHARDDSQRLESLVKERTAEIARRNDAMRLLLDSMDQGFLTVDHDGLVSSERSAIVDRWIPALRTSPTLWSAVKSIDRRAGSRLQLAWLMVTDAIVPIEVALDQLPKLMQINDREIELRYTSAGSKVLCVFTDVTDERQRKRLERTEGQRLALFTLLSKNRPVLEAFVAETDDMLSELADGVSTSEERRRHVLHTLKGNCATLGLTILSTACHKAEDELLESRSLLPIAGLRADWTALRDWVSPFLTRSDRRIEIKEQEYHQFLNGLLSPRPREQLHRWASAWALEPTEVRLKLLTDGARLHADRLGRQIDIEFSSSDLKTNPTKMNGVWSGLVHALRNAVDHGTETESARVGAGKPRRVRISLATKLVGSELCLEVSDDGPGIDWRGVVARAAELGFPANDNEEPVELLFRDALSTRRAATESSGRGIGMGALRSAITNVGGRVEVESKRARGTTIRCLIPAVLVDAIAS